MNQVLALLLYEVIKKNEFYPRMFLAEMLQLFPSEYEKIVQTAELIDSLEVEK